MTIPLAAQFEARRIEIGLPPNGLGYFETVKQLEGDHHRFNSRV
jgi:hypothetical protein